MALQKTIEASQTKSALQTVAIFFLILVVACILLSALYLILTTKYRHAQDNLVQAQLDMALLRSENKEILEKKEKDIAYYRQEVCNYQKSLFWLNKMSLNERLQKSVIAKRLISMASNNPPIQASSSDFFQLEELIVKEIPTFKDITKPCQDDGLVLGYRMCLLIRAGFGPTDISKLMGISPSSVTKMRIRLLKLIFHREGRAEDFDEAIRTLSN